MKKLLNSSLVTLVESRNGREYDEEDYNFPYSRSFQARLIQSTDEVKDLYNTLKNKIMSYKKITAHYAWNHESFNIGRQQYFKFKIKGKSLFLLMKSNPSDYDKFSGEMIANKKYAKTPYCYRVNGDRRSLYALELIDLLVEKEGLVPNKKFQPTNYIPSLAYQSTEKLLVKGLIKEIGSDYTPLTEVTMEEAEQVMTDTLAKEFITEKNVGQNIPNSQLVPVNLGLLEDNFKNGDVVTLEVLKEKKLLAKNVKGIKILAGGKLTKALTVEANQWSLAAVKMIALLGGDIIKVN